MLGLCVVGVRGGRDLVEDSFVVLDYFEEFGYVSVGFGSGVVVGV